MVTDAPGVTLPQYSTRRKIGGYLSVVSPLSYIFVVVFFHEWSSQVKLDIPQTKMV